MKYLYFSILWVASVSASAEIAGGKVKGFIVSENGTASLRLVENNSACATGNSGWDYNFPINSTYGDLWSSMILAARMSDSTIRVVYTPNPSGACSIKSVYFYDY